MVSDDLLSAERENMYILLQVRGENKFLHIGEAFSWIVKFKNEEKTHELY